jgi:hypothetical protein
LRWNALSHCIPLEMAHGKRALCKRLLTGAIRRDGDGSHAAPGNYSWHCALIFGTCNRRLEGAQGAYDVSRSDIPQTRRQAWCIRWIHRRQHAHCIVYCVHMEGRARPSQQAIGGHAPARNLPLGQDIVANALDAGFIAARARREALVAAVFAKAAAIARAHVAERRRGRAGRWRRGRGGGLRVGDVWRGRLVAVVRGLLQGALEARHGASDPGRMAGWLRRMRQG